MSIRLKKNFNLDRINLDLTKELNYVAQAIKSDHYQRLEVGLDANEKPMQPLSEVTIKAKGHDKILVETGKMRNLVIEKATKHKQRAILHPGNKQTYPGTDLTMADVGLKHQTGVPPKLPKREWFGVTKSAFARAVKIISQRIDQELRNA